MKKTVQVISKSLVVDHHIRAVLCDGNWIKLPPAEWKFLLRIAGPNWNAAGTTGRFRKRAERLRRRIGTVRVDLVRGMGYRLADPIQARKVAR